MVGWGLIFTTFTTDKGLASRIQEEKQKKLSKE
jgi:hypothetical protein